MNWRDLLSGFWFVPGVVAVAHAALAVVLLAIDHSFGANGLVFAFGGSGSAARSLLATIAGSIVTVAGLTFTLTVVTLQLVSGQFSPRATRTLLGDPTSQVAAGVFVGIVLYCLVVLRSIRDSTATADGFVPGLSVTVAIALAVLGLAMLLVFVHHTAQTIKVSNIAARVGAQTLEAIDDLYPEPYGEPALDPPPPAAADGATVVRAQRPGYVQSVDVDALAERLGGRGVVIELPIFPGDFVTAESAIAIVSGADEDQVEAAVGDAVAIENERDVAEDVRFGIQQLADVALRAISPSVNDPSTAVTCIGYVAAALERLACRRFPAPVREYPESGTTVVSPGPSFDAYVREAFVDIGRYASSDARVASAVLEAIERVAAAAVEAGSHERLAVLGETARRVVEPALEDARTEADQAALEAAFERVERCVKRRLTSL